MQVQERTLAQPSGTESIKPLHQTKQASPTPDKAEDPSAGGSYIAGGSSEALNHPACVRCEAPLLPLWPTDVEHPVSCHPSATGEPGDRFSLTADQRWSSSNGVTAPNCRTANSSLSFNPKEAGSPQLLEPSTPNMAAGSQAQTPPDSESSPTAGTQSVTAYLPLTASVHHAPGEIAASAPPEPSDSDISPDIPAEELATASIVGAMDIDTMASISTMSPGVGDRAGPFANDRSEYDPRKGPPWIKLALCQSREEAEKWLADTGLVYVWQSGGGKKGGHIQCCKSHRNCTNQVRIALVRSGWQVSTRGAHCGPQLVKPGKGIIKRYLEDTDRSCRKNIDATQTLANLKAKFGPLPDLPTPNQIRNRKRTLVLKDKGLKRQKSMKIGSREESSRPLDQAPLRDGNTAGPQQPQTEAVFLQTPALAH